ncbi:MAG: sensor histidine kinase [Mucilaginibacter sp.]
MAKKVSYKTVLRHVLFWMVYIVYQAVHQGWSDGDTFNFSIGHEFISDVPVAILLAYLNLYGLMPAFFYKQKYTLYVIAFTLLLLIGGLMERFAGWYIWMPWDKVHYPEVYKSENKNFWIPVKIARNAIEDFSVIIITMVIKLMRNSYQHEKKLREIEQEKFSAEMGLLKAQINPHFFFNTLNSLYALTLKGSEQASKVVLRLSDLMHYMLYDASANKVLLKDEIKYLENYIGIEQMRFADRLELSFQYSGEITGKIIAPLLLLPFIENAFKHGIGDNSGWITIDIKVTGSKLFLKVGNSCSASVKVNSTGLGLRNVKRRLELSYPGAYELHMANNGDFFEVDLKVDL